MKIGKVAGIFSGRELFINLGSADGVGLGMRFAVLNRKGIDVKDPDTGELLGSAELANAIVKVVRIENEHLSTARTFRPKADTGPHVERLGSRYGEYLNMEVDLGDTFINIGDRVVLMVGDEYDDVYGEM